MFPLGWWGRSRQAGFEGECRGAQVTCTDDLPAIRCCPDVERLSSLLHVESVSYSPSFPLGRNANPLGGVMEGAGVAVRSASPQARGRAGDVAMVIRVSPQGRRG
ncbi:hypothetical protein SKAU_G00045610 [Synaphobranchus kaupii]|uniref:Uncharacterized protein n=1 Tax=Synaphobranchus kaupii TaxID=118154 RepID=A0A9Q1J858_SYNKA|nr:hypothetical protein SKAU_G00045610 [Synaphobranchus kaupii]